MRRQKVMIERLQSPAPAVRNALPDTLEGGAVKEKMLDITDPRRFPKFFRVVAIVRASECSTVEEVIATVKRLLPVSFSLTSVEETEDSRDR